jgi:hypothetical protein
MTMLLRRPSRSAYTTELHGLAARDGQEWAGQDVWGSGVAVDVSIVVEGCLAVAFVELFERRVVLE